VRRARVEGVTEAKVQRTSSSRAHGQAGAHELLEFDRHLLFGALVRAQSLVTARGQVRSDTFSFI